MHRLRHCPVLARLRPRFKPAHRLRRESGAARWGVAKLPLWRDMNGFLHIGVSKVDALTKGIAQPTLAQTPRAGK